MKNTDKKLIYADKGLSSPVGSFDSRANQDGNSQSKNPNSKTRNGISKLKSNHNLAASFVSHQLTNQQLNVNTNPNSTISILPMSSVEKNGPITMPARNTWPALSNILANLSSSSLAKNNSFLNNESIINYSSMNYSSFQHFRVGEMSLTTCLSFKNMKKLLFYLNLFFTGKEQKKSQNKEQYVNHLSAGYIVNQIHSVSRISSALSANFQDSIASKIFSVNTREFPTEPGIAAIHKTTRFEQTAENTFSWADVTINMSTNRLSAIFSFVNLRRYKCIVLNYLSFKNMKNTDKKRIYVYGRKGLPFGRFSAKGNITECESNNYQGKSNLSYDLRIPESSEIHYLFLLNQYAKSNDNIPNTISVVNIHILGAWLNPGNTGDTIATPNQNTEKLINQSEITENRAESTFFTSNNSNISSDELQHFRVGDIVLNYLSKF